MEGRVSGAAGCYADAMRTLSFAAGKFRNLLFRASAVIEEPPSPQG
jgi:hypothetical protein